MISFVTTAAFIVPPFRMMFCIEVRQMRFIRHYPVWMRSEKGEENCPVAFTTGRRLRWRYGGVAVFGVPEIIINGLFQSFGNVFTATPCCCAILPTAKAIAGRLSEYLSVPVVPGLRRSGPRRILSKRFTCRHQHLIGDTYAPEAITPSPMPGKIKALLHGR